MQYIAGPAKTLHSLHSTMSQDIMGSMLPTGLVASAVPCHHTVDSVTAQQLRVVEIEV